MLSGSEEGCLLLCRNLNKVLTSKITKPKQSSRLRRSTKLQAEDHPMPEDQSEEVEGYIDDPMDEDFVPGGTLGSGPPRRASEKRLSSRQAGAKRLRQESSSEEEEGASDCLLLHIIRSLA